MQCTTLWLVRHTLPEGGEGRCYGRYDLPLSAEGVQHAKALAHQFEGQSITHVYSSGLSRAAETARILAEPHGLAVSVVDSLAELHFGDLEGLTNAEIEERYPQVFRSWMERPLETHFPNGESFAQMRARVLPAMNSLLSRHENECIIVVAHAGVIRTVLGNVLGLPDDHIFRLAQRYGAINRIHYFDDNSAVVDLMNGTSLP
jgi:alpha-ribazole phosphatase